MHNGKEPNKVGVIFAFVAGGAFIAAMSLLPTQCSPKAKAEPIHQIK